MTQVIFVINVERKKIMDLTKLELLDFVRIELNKIDKRKKEIDKITDFNERITETAKQTGKLDMIITLQKKLL